MTKGHKAALIIGTVFALLALLATMLSVILFAETFAPDLHVPDSPAEQIGQGLGRAMTLIVSILYALGGGAFGLLGIVCSLLPLRSGVKVGRTWGTVLLAVSGTALAVSLFILLFSILQ